MDDAEVVGNLVLRLLRELVPERADTFEPEIFTKRAQRLLLNDDLVCGFLACDDDDEAVGLIMLAECTAIYAGGTFGVITELYVPPEDRSKGIASSLIQAAATFAKERDWTHLEVTAPPLPTWRRTVDFYLREGFTVVGPRLKRTL
jgi:predicted N-acetyltransferase YhbS